jgi:hypothetical protein
VTHEDRIRALERMVMVARPEFAPGPVPPMALGLAQHTPGELVVIEGECSAPEAAPARHLVITAADAARLAAALAGATDPDLRRIGDRLAVDTGGDMREIAGLLKHLEVCAACNIEGQARSCNSLEAQRIGRRLSRLIDRAEVTP